MLELQNQNNCINIILGVFLWSSLNVVLILLIYITLTPGFIKHARSFKIVD
jgi:hypothetical protein